MQQKKRKLTLKDKKNFTKQGICWKCQERPIVKGEFMCEECLKIGN